MTYLQKENTWETSTDTGTGDLDLAGGVAGAQGFVAAYGGGNCFWAYLTNRRFGGNDWEQAWCKVVDGSPDTLQRLVTLSGSNGASPVNWPSGGLDIIGMAPLGEMMLGVTRVNKSSQSGFTNSLTDLQGMTLPVQVGECYELDGVFVFSNTGASGGVAVRLTGCPGLSNLSYFGNSTSGVLFGQSVGKSNDENSMFFGAYVGTARVHIRGYIEPDTAGTAKFQGITGGSGTTSSFGDGSVLRCTRVPA